ncbi:MAG TPA: cyclic nucleotide-binding domain-containing protein [Coriobacteriia bacterium]
MSGIVKTYSDGEVIFRKGDPSGGMYVIRAGQVAVLRKDDDAEATLATLKSGDFFGEMSLFDGKPRSATVRAIGDVEVEAVSREELVGQVGTDAVWHMLVKLSGRMRAVDDLLEKFAAEAASRQDALAAISIRRNLYY